MAQLTANQLLRVFLNGEAERTCLYAIKNFSTNDTVDVAADFSVPKVAVILSTTNLVKGVCTISGTMITLAPATTAGDAGYMLIWGAAS